jgi:ATP-dependent helicase/nuclease subunit B
MREAAPRVRSIPAGVPFLPTLVDALLEGRLVPDFVHDGDPLALADVTIYLPTRRAARALRGVFLERLGGRAAILPVIRPLGEFDDDGLFEADAASLSLAPPIAALDRLLMLAPLVQAWKQRLPAHLAQLYGEDIVVPASFADAIWLARDLADLIDEVETEGADWTRLAGLAPGDLAVWWQVTLEFLSIVTEAWPAHLAEMGRSNPAAHRGAMMDAETERLRRRPPPGPVVAAGSTGSIPATARLLSVVARLPRGAVVLPGLSADVDEESWREIGAADQPPSHFGHPQAGLRRLLDKLGVDRGDVEQIAAVPPALAARMRLATEALRPAATTDGWHEARRHLAPAIATGALEGLTLIEAPAERDEALAVAVALRLAVADEGRRAALVTGDRDLARRVSAELARFGIRSDDSGGTPLSATAPARLLAHLLEAVFRPGDPVPILAMLKHPLLRLGLGADRVRAAAGTIELVALRGAVGRPSVATLGAAWSQRLSSLEDDSRKPFWWPAVDERSRAEAEELLTALADAVRPLAGLGGTEGATTGAFARASIVALEALATDEAGRLDGLYGGDAGERLAGFLRDMLAAPGDAIIGASEWPDVVRALMAGETVKPSAAGDGRVAIWGTLEARLQSVDTLVLAGLNEGTWPRRADSGRFMSRLMKRGLELEPPERRIGQAAHDFYMALGAPRIVLSRSARSGDAPAVPSRWLQRLTAFAGDDAIAPARRRGRDLLRWARGLDAGPGRPFADRPKPCPPVAMRPRDFSVTEIETLRRDPYALYARRILGLQPLEPLLGEPGAADRGTLFHDALHGFLVAGIDPLAPDALARFVAIGREVFAEAKLPPDVEAVWWPRFERMAAAMLDWERGRGRLVRHGEIAAARTPVGPAGHTLRGRADRIDVMPQGLAEIIDFKTGSSPTKAQAHAMIAPQLALEAALLSRGAFSAVGPIEASDLLYVRLKPSGEVEPQSILTHNRSIRTAGDMAEEAWERLGRLLAHYDDPASGYLSRALPFRAGDFSGDYDHLARAREWSAGADAGGED